MQRIQASGAAGSINLGARAAGKARSGRVVWNPRIEDHHESSADPATDLEMRRGANNFFILAHASVHLADRRKVEWKSLFGMQLRHVSGTIFLLSAASYRDRHFLGTHWDDCSRCRCGSPA